MAIDVNKIAKEIAEAAEAYEKQYGHLPSRARVTLSKSDMAVAYELAKQEREQADRRELLRKAQANRQLDTVAEVIQVRDGGSHAQSVAKALDENPDLYQV
jgi:hypothetical protein